MNKKPLIKVLLVISTIIIFSLPHKARAIDWAQAGLWTGAGAASILYLPLKGVFMVLMAFGGGSSYGVTYFIDQMDFSEQIVKWGFYGDYLLRPEHLVLEEYPQFIGFDEEIHFWDL